jgi:copper chaperone CopZ
MNTLTVKANDISCSHCVHTIQSEVGEVAGVKNVVANEQTKLVTITYDQPATEQQLKELLAEIGYPAEAA